MNILNIINQYQEVINKERPFLGDKLEQIRDYYRIDLTYSSNAIEGNTLTRSETKIILEDGLTIGGKKTWEIFEAVGHAEAYDYMFTLLKNRSIKEDDILQLHYLFYNAIKKEEAGAYRKKDVFITGSSYEVADKNQIKEKMRDLCEWLEESRDKCHPVELAAVLHKKFVFIHPFVDGNGRVARLLMNTVLIQDGFLPVVIPPILRDSYVSSLEKAHTNDKDFKTLIAECAHQSQKDFMRFMHIQPPKVDGLTR